MLYNRFAGSAGAGAPLCVRLSVWGGMLVVCYGVVYGCGRMGMDSTGVVHV